MILHVAEAGAVGDRLLEGRMATRVSLRNLDTCLADRAGRVDAVVLSPCAGDAVDLARRVRAAAPGVPVLVLLPSDQEPRDLDRLRGPGVQSAPADDLPAARGTLEGLLGARPRVVPTRPAGNGRDRALRIHRLAEAALEISSDLSLGETLERVTEQARRLIGAHRAATRLTLDKDGGRYVDHESVSHTSPETGDEPPSLGGGHAQIVRDTNRPLRLTTDALPGPAGAPPEAHGWLAAPLVGRDGRNMGLIELSGKLDGEFTEEDEHTLVQLAQMASAAIENAHLYEAAQAAEVRARNQLGFTRAITASMGEGVYSLDREGRVTFANPAAERMLGYPQAELLGQRMHELIHRGHGSDAPLAENECRILEVLRTGKSLHAEEDLFENRDGRRFPVSYTAAPIHEEGEMTGVVVAFRDVTERHRHQAELEAAHRQVAVSEKLSALGTLVSGVAHEIRTPLTFISNHLFLVQRRLEQAIKNGDTHDLEDALRSTHEAVSGLQRVNHLVKDLRRYTRLETGRRASVRLAGVVADAVRLFHAAYRGRLRVEADLKGDRELLLDEVQIQQVVLNLLTNAAEAMPEGGVVRIHTRDEEWASVIVVEDEGPGIPEALRADLFEPFHTTKSEGTGLGLSIVKRIVDAHAGRIQVETAEGRGARFEVWFPADAGGEGAGNREPRQSP